MTLKNVEIKCMVCHGADSKCGVCQGKGFITTDRRFGVDPTVCKLCTDGYCTLANITDAALCKEWLHAANVKYSSGKVWSFVEYKPGYFALYGPGRRVYLLTTDWNEVLEFYRNRPSYIPPERPVSREERPVSLSGLDTSKLNIKL